MNDRLFSEVVWYAGKLREESYYSGARYINGHEVRASIGNIVDFRKFEVLFDAQLHDSRLSSVAVEFPLLKPERFC